MHPAWAVWCLLQSSVRHLSSYFCHYKVQQDKKLTSSSDKNRPVLCLKSLMVRHIILIVSMVVGSCLVPDFILRMSVVDDVAFRVMHNHTY